jgi:hypothetical protein
MRAKAVRMSSTALNLAPRMRTTPWGMKDTLMAYSGDPKIRSIAPSRTAARPRVATIPMKWWRPVVRWRTSR